MNNRKVRVYLASQIFAECWREYNERVAKAIEEAYPNIELYVPQRNNSINDKTKCASAEDICAGDFTNNLDHDDIVVAIVDGDTPGIGTTLEVGYFSRICQEEIEKFGNTKKKIIVSVILTTGVSGIFFLSQSFAGVSLAMVFGVILNLILKEGKKA